MEKHSSVSNACVNNFLAEVKSVPNFTVFCRKSEKCRNFSLLLSFSGKLWLFMAIYGTFKNSMAIYATFFALLACYTVLWRINFCRNLCTFSGKIIWAQTLNIEGTGAYNALLQCWLICPNYIPFIHIVGTHCEDTHLKINIGVGQFLICYF